MKGLSGNLSEMRYMNFETSKFLGYGVIFHTKMFDGTLI